MPTDRRCDLVVGVVHGSHLQPNRFLLSGKDRQPIRLTDMQRGIVYEVQYPGKSAFLYFGSDTDRGIRGNVIRESMKREVTRNDHLHLATVGWIDEANWQAWWTPLPERDNWGHVRLIATSTVERGVDPTLEEAKALSEVFVKAF